MLSGVRIYRGQASNIRDRKGYTASRRQYSVWESDPLITIVSRTLNYPPGWPDSHQPGEKPREKGIDVALAMDFAIMGMRHEYDVGILFSMDTDLKPSLEFVTDLTRARGKPRAEVAAWSAPDQKNGRLSVSGKQIYCHWIGEDVYDGVRDNTNYSYKA